MTSISEDLCEERSGDIKEIALSAHHKTSFWRNIGGVIVAFAFISFCTVVLGIYFYINSVKDRATAGITRNEKAIERLDIHMQYTKDTVTTIHTEQQKMKKEILDEIRKPK